MVYQQEKSNWQLKLGMVCAYLMAALWIVAGAWKLSDLGAWALKMNQALVPVDYALPLGLAVAVGEVILAILLVVPAWRKLGGYASAGLLIAFMAYFAINYAELQGADCSCFPWLERAVGPQFFITDGIMVVLSLIAAWHSQPFSGLKHAALAVAAACAWGAVSYTMEATSTPPDENVPASIALVEGEHDLHSGRTLVFFFDPTCIHCLDVAEHMSTLDWEADIVGVPIQLADLTGGFLADSKLAEKEILVSAPFPEQKIQEFRETFQFQDVPFAVALHDGQIAETFEYFEGDRFDTPLRDKGFIR